MESTGSYISLVLRGRGVDCGGGGVTRMDRLD
jgi:hypothetical protein